MRVIRCGQKREQSGISPKDVETLRNYWALEEQLGIRKPPEDDFLNHIPQITLDKPTNGGDNEK